MSIAKVICVRLSIPLVRHRSFAPFDEVDQSGVDRIVYRRRHVVLQTLTNQLRGAVLAGALAPVAPLLERRRVAERRFVERGLVVAQRVLGGEEVLAGADLGETIL